MASRHATAPKPLQQRGIQPVRAKYHPLVPGTYTGDSSGYRTEDRPDHRGVDIAADYGTPIYAPADGFFVHVGIEDDPGGFGSWLWIDAQQEWGLDFVLGHMPP
nr:M23 family metallopeptidase [Mycobacterium gordonae]